MEPELKGKLDYEHLGNDLTQKYIRNFQKIEIAKEKSLRVMQARLDRSEKESITKKLQEYKNSKAAEKLNEEIEYKRHYRRDKETKK